MQNSGQKCLVSSDGEGRCKTKNPPNQNHKYCSQNTMWALLLYSISTPALIDSAAVTGVSYLFRNDVKLRPLACFTFPSIFVQEALKLFLDTDEEMIQERNLSSLNPVLRTFVLNMSSVWWTLIFDIWCICVKECNRKAKLSTGNTKSHF